MSRVEIANVVPEGQCGIARVERFSVSEHDSMMSSIRCGGFVPQGNYSRLFVGRTLMMSDTPAEQRDNWPIVHNANGSVLVAGLGLGVLLAAILTKPEVKSVLVIEKFPDVIDLIAPHFTSKKLSVICADIFDWQPPKGQKWDAIWFDIWPDKCTDNLKQVATLHQRYKSRLNRDNPRAWMGSWAQDELRAIKRREAACDWTW